MPRNDEMPYEGDALITKQKTLQDHLYANDFTYNRSIQTE